MIYSVDNVQFVATRPDVPVKIRFNDIIGEGERGQVPDIPPKSLWSMLQETVARVPDNTALAVKRNGVWVKWTYAEYMRDIVTVAKAFIKLGLQPHHSVGILGKICPNKTQSLICCCPRS